MLFLNIPHNAHELKTDCYDTLLIYHNVMGITLKSLCEPYFI